MADRRPINSNFNTANQTFRQLFGNGLRYQVPRFQRDYSWDRDQWDDLWQDIENLLSPKGDSSHYMGYLVLKTDDNRVFDVIDGQQRLTTISVIVLAAMKTLQDFVESGVESDANRRRLEQIRNSYIGYLDPVTLISQPKLALNRNNDGYYKDYILVLGSIPMRGRKVTERSLGKAFEWFYEQIRNRYFSLRSGEEIARFLEQVVDRLFFTVITVPSELNAYLVFETLNSRGVRLSPTDLLKNYLFSIVDRESNDAEAVNELERKWELIVQRLGEESFPDFLRTHWNSRNGFTRESELFKTIRAQILDSGAVFELLRAMDEDVDFYVALREPTGDYWNSEQRPAVQQLKMFNVRQPWPLLMAAHRQFEEEGFTRILKGCVVISLRYNVIGALAGNEQERRYNEVASRIHKGESYRRAEHVFRDLRTVYIQDEQFRAAFAERQLKTTLPRNKSVVRWMLFEIEAELSGKPYDRESAEFTLEHILPENPGANWPQFKERQAEDCLYRLGNMTLLERSINRDLGSSSAAEKLQRFAESCFVMTREIAKSNDVWTAERISARQQRLAEIAVSLWRIPQMYE